MAPGIFPAASLKPGQRSLETAWLLRHWNEWLCYTCSSDGQGELVALPVEGTQVIRWDEREISIRHNADSRSP